MQKSLPALFQMQGKLKTYQNSNLRDFSRPAFRYYAYERFISYNIYVKCRVIYVSDFKQILVFYKLHPVKKYFYLKKIYICYMYVTIKFKHCYTIPSFCALYFTKKKGLNFFVKSYVIWRYFLEIEFNINLQYISFLKTVMLKKVKCLKTGTPTIYA